MKKSIPLIAGALALALLFGWGGYYFGQRDAAPPRRAITTAAAEQAGQTRANEKPGRSPLYWHDPMVPGPRFDKPGKSPFMDMQLVPVYAEEGSDEGRVSISPRTVQNLGIRTVAVKQGDMEGGLTTVGTVTVDERTIATVQARVSGYVEKLYVRAQYDPVAAGQPLADIYAPDWLAAQQEYLTLKRGRIAGDESLLQAARQRLSLLGIAEQQIQRMEREGKANPRVTLYAPQAGLVWELGVRDGQAVSPGITLFKLASLASVWVNAEIPETQVAEVRPGVAVEARTAAMPQRIFKGQVAALLPEVNPTTRTIKARIVLANPDRLLQPGMFARIAFTGSKQRALMVPNEAVIHTGTRTVVILAEEGGKFRPVDVEAGQEDGNLTEIRKGLSEGQKVVVSGQFLIDSEASLKSTLDRLQGASTNPATGRPEIKP